MNPSDGVFMATLLDAPGPDLGRIQYKSNKRKNLRASKLKVLKYIECEWENNYLARFENNNSKQTLKNIQCIFIYVQGVIQICTDILTTSYWHHVELGKNI
jgi:hypothetical protein